MEKESIEKTSENSVYYVAEVPTGLTNVIAFNGKAISPEELLVKVANILVKEGIMKSD